MRSTRFSVALGIVLTVAVVQAQDYPPGTFELTPQIDLGLQPVRVDVPGPFQDAIPPGATLNLPPGFSVGVFAAHGLSGPRFLASSPQGVLHVANMGAGQIVALPDGDDNGVADEIIVVLEDLREAHSLAFYQDALYSRLD